MRNMEEREREIIEMERCRTGKECAGLALRSDARVTVAGLDSKGFPPSTQPQSTFHYSKLSRISSYETRSRTRRGNCTNMLAQRPLLRLQQPWRLCARRPFSTTELGNGINMAYELYEPEKETQGSPIILVHGLFGSKRNYRYELDGDMFSDLSWLLM